MIKMTNTILKVSKCQVFGFFVFNKQFYTLLATLQSTPYTQHQHPFTFTTLPSYILSTQTHSTMGKKGKKKKKGPAEPTDPYAGYLVIKLKFGLGDPKGIEFTCMFRNRKTEEKYDAPATVGDLFKELWRQSEQNEEFDEEHTEGRRFVFFGPLVGNKKEKTQQQVVMIYKGDTELELEKDLGFKSHEVVAFDSLTDKAWNVMIEKRPEDGKRDDNGVPTNAWKRYLDAKWYVPPPPEPVEGEE